MPNCRSRAEEIYSILNVYLNPLGTRFYFSESLFEWCHLHEIDYIVLFSRKLLCYILYIIIYQRILHKIPLLPFSSL